MTELAALPETALSLRAALSIITEAPADGDALTVGLLSGFTPLHLTTFVQAYAQRTYPNRRAVVSTGTYGDIVTAAGDLGQHSLDGAVVFLEWADLDLRLSPRRSGAPVDPTDLVETSERRAGMLRSRLAAIAARTPMVVVPPRTAFPPYFPTRRLQQSPAEAGVRSVLARLLVELAAEHRVRVATDVVRTVQPVEDVRMLMKADFPYTVVFASSTAQDAVELLYPAPPKKGLITDLDDTLWRGLVGEIGADAVTWDLDHDSQPHAAYQQLLAQLARRGVLLGVASKNEQAVVETALARPDLGVPRDALYPVLASWEPKSLAVGKILAAWNIGASDVVVVDDNPLELAQIAEAYPDITTALMQPKDATSVLTLIRDLHAVFARDGDVGVEDSLRVASLKAGAQFADLGGQADDYRAFLAEVDADLLLSTTEAHSVARAYELVQKTNQFNLNGRRHDPALWAALGERPGSVSLSARYRDKFGDLGLISVLTGTRDGAVITVDAWVLSCRAFSRAVEHHMLRALFDCFDVNAVRFDYAATDKNGPVHGFLTGFGVQREDGYVEVTRAAFEDEKLARLHRVQVDGSPFTTPIGG